MLVCDSISAELEKVASWTVVSKMTNVTPRDGSAGVSKSPIAHPSRFKKSRSGEVVPADPWTPRFASIEPLIPFGVTWMDPAVFA